jgi:hypothetical protein
MEKRYAGSIELEIETGLKSGHYRCDDFYNLIRFL